MARDSEWISWENVGLFVRKDDRQLGLMPKSIAGKTWYLGLLGQPRARIHKGGLGIEVHGKVIQSSGSFSPIDEPLGEGISVSITLYDL